MTKTKQITKLSAMMLAAVSFTACWDAQQPSALEEKPAETRLFTFHVKGSFSVSYTDFEDTDTQSATRAVRLEDDNTAGITDLWVLDYQNGTLVQMVHQVAGSEGFGHPQMTMTYGEHDVKLIASKGDTPVLTATTGTASTTNAPHSLQWQKVRDTFTLSYPVTVTATSNGNRAPELQRGVGGMTVHMTDAVPQEAHTVDVQWLNSRALMLPSLSAAAVDPEGGSVSEGAALGTGTLTFPQSFVGKAGKAFTVYTLVGSEDLTTDVTLTFRTTEGDVLSTRTIQGVSIRRNRMSVLTGGCFGQEQSAQDFEVSVASEWDEPWGKDF